jgi:hypothetical protein
MVVVAVAFAALDDLELLQQHASKCVCHANVAQYQTCLQRIENDKPQPFLLQWKRTELQRMEGPRQDHFEPALMKKLLA